MKENYELIDNEERHQYEFHIERWWRKCSWISKRKTYASFRYVRS